MDRGLGRRWAINLLATINETNMGSVVQRHRHLYWLGRSIGIKNRIDITGLQTTILITRHPAAPWRSGLWAVVYQTRDFRANNSQNGCVDDWYNYWMYWFIIPRQVSCRLLSSILSNCLPRNGGMQKGNHEDEWLNTEISEGVTIDCFGWTPGRTGSSSPL